MKNIEKVLEKLSIDKLNLEIANQDKQLIFTKVIQDMDSKQKTNDKRNSSFLFKYKYYMGFVLILIIMLSSLGGYYALNYLISTGGEETALISSNLNYKDMARAKFLAMTGLEYSDYKKINVSELAANTAADKTNMRMNANRPAFSESSGLDIQPQDVNKVFYSKVESKILSDSFPYYAPILMDMKKNTTYITESWINGLTSKTIVKVDNKIVNFSLYSNKESISYIGGKYGIKSIYNYPDTYVSYPYAYNDDPNLTFLKWILESEFVEEIGTETIDGKKVAVFEEKFDYSEYLPETPIETQPLPYIEKEGSSAEYIDGPVGSYEETEAINEKRKVASTDSTISSEPINGGIIATSTKYFVDLESFNLVKIDNYEDSVLVHSQKFLENKEYDNVNESGILSLKELNNIELKEVIYDEEYYLPTKFSSYFDELDIYYLKDTRLTSLSVPSEDEYMKLAYTKDYDPNFVEFEEIYVSYTYAYYDEFGTAYIIYDQEPEFYIDPNAVKSNISVIIDAKKWDGTAYTTKGMFAQGSCLPSRGGVEGDDSSYIVECNDGTDQEFETYDIVIKMDKKWLLLNSSSKLDLNNLILVKLDKDNASKFDQYITESNSIYGYTTLDANYDEERRLDGLVKACNDLICKGDSSSSDSIKKEEK